MHASYKDSTKSYSQLLLDDREEVLDMNMIFFHSATWCLKKHWDHGLSCSENDLYVTLVYVIICQVGGTTHGLFC